MQVLIDSCIYRQDRRRNKSAFRAVRRLAQAGSLHIPAFVKNEALTRQQQDTREDINTITAAAGRILRRTNDATLRAHAENLEQIATKTGKQTDTWLADDLQQWIAEVQATEHPISDDHGTRVAAAYFAGKPPFKTVKSREDIPDSFIWETALDLVQEHGELIVVSADGRLRNVAEEHEHMTAYKSLDDFIESDDCQEALGDLMTSEAIANNIERIKALLPETTEPLLQSLEDGVVDELAWKTVRHHAIPEDNNEASISSVGAPENVEFDFAATEHYGDGDLGIPFTATVDCELNFRIYRGDHYALDEEEEISVSEWSDHYLDANKTYTISINGSLNLQIDTSLLEDDELTNEELQTIISEADKETDVTERAVHVPEY